MKLPLADQYRARGQDFDVHVLGRLRADGMWEARLSFVPAGQGKELVTKVESVQSNERGVRRWAEGLGPAFIEGAFNRAWSLANPKQPAKVGKPIRDTLSIRLEDVARFVMNCFRTARESTLPLKTIFDCAEEYANADVVRAIEDLERDRLVVRFTHGGSVWVALTNAATRQPRRPSTQKISRPRTTVPQRRGRHSWRGTGQPELIYEHPHLIRLPDGREFETVVLGVQRTEGTWSGWIQFRDIRTNEKLRTDQETSQPNRDSLAYWASGVEDLYLEGALARSTRLPGLEKPRSRQPKAKSRRSRSE